MKNEHLTAWQEIEAKGSYIFFLLLTTITIVATSFLITANMKIKSILIPITVGSICIILSYMIYRKKQNNKRADLYSWIVSILFVLAPIVAKYNYSKQISWDFALTSYNSSMLIIVAVLIVYFLYNKLLFKFISLFAISNWILFIVVAYFNGANITLNVMLDGKPTYGFPLLREVFVMIMGIISWWAIYKLMVMLQAYEDKTSSQKKLIEDQNIYLEQKVEDRTHELQEAYEKLQELDKLKSNFFANISHEIRTPLTLILSPIESILQGDYKGDTDKTFYTNLHRNAIRLLRMVNNLLDFSKIEAGKMGLMVREIDIAKVAKNYYDTVESACKSKDITWKLDLKNESLKIYADIEKIDKVAMNLFSNAIKFTDKGGKIILRIYDDEHRCFVELEDTGIGIPSDKIDTIFDRFSQVDIGSTRKYEGTGIGLSLAKEFVELHGGTISVKSRYIKDHPSDHGTLFTISLPKGKEHYERLDYAQFVDRDRQIESTSDYQFRGIKDMSDFKITQRPDDDYFHKNNESKELLIVEDNSDMCDFLKSILKKQYTVHIAVDGKDGFDKAIKLKPDMIITDVMMPNIDGYTMTKMIKENDRLKRIPVLMLTAKADIAHKIEGLEYGADDYLTKPFNSKELLVRIKSLLKGREYERVIEERKNEIENELEIARLLQQKLLPETIPEISGYRSHVIYKPMDMVGGDFYDFKANDDIIELFIADVSGHGLHGAFIAMITKMAFESIRERKSTSSVMYILNDIIHRSTVQSNFVTALYCIIKRDTNTLIFSNAGHQPLLIYRPKSNEFFELNSTGIPLGLSKDIELEEKEMQLMKGDRVVLYTDGIVECTDPARKEFGDDGFRDFIRSNSALPPNKFTEKLLSTLQAYSCKNTFNDDVCLIVFDVM